MPSPPSASRAKSTVKDHHMRRRARFGSVVDISPDGFRQEVTDVADDDLRVVVHLYADNTPACRVVDQLLQLLAGKHPCTKFAVLSRPHLISSLEESWRIELTCAYACVSVCVHRRHLCSAFST